MSSNLINQDKKLIEVEKGKETLSVKSNVRRNFNRGKGPKIDSKSKSYLQSHVVRIKRINHTKAGGRVWSYQATVIVGDGLGNFGWSASKSSQAFSSRSKALKRAQRRMVRINFDSVNKTFLSDKKIKLGKGRFILFKKQRPGMGITASPIISKILSLIGIENAVVKTINGPDVLTSIRYLIDTLKFRGTIK